MNCCNGNCRQGRDCPNRVTIRGFKVPTWVFFLFLFFILFGIVGHMDFIDSVREEYQSKCNGTIDVEGDLVTCTAENQSPKIIGVLK